MNSNSNNDDKFIELKVTGKYSELESFICLIHLISTFKKYNISQKIDVIVNGDNSKNLSFFEKTKENKYVEFPTFELDDIRKLEKTTNGKFVIIIGE